MQVAADTVLFTPVYVGSFFAFMNSMEGGGLEAGDLGSCCPFLSIYFCQSDLSVPWSSRLQYSPCQTAIEGFHAAAGPEREMRKGLLDYNSDRDGGVAAIPGHPFTH